MSELDGIPLAPDTTAPAPALQGIPLADTRLRDSYDQGSRVPPDDAAKHIGIANRLGVSAAAVADNMKDAVAADQRPSDDFLDDVTKNYPKTAGLLADPAKMAVVHDDLGNLVAHDHVVQHFEQATSYYQAVKAGLQGSVFGHVYDRGAPSIVTGPKSSYGQGLLAAGVGMAADFPFMVIGGGLAGVLGTPLAAGPGAFALPAFLKTSISEYYRTGDSTGITNDLEKAFNVAKETGKGALIGLFTELTGGAVNKATIGAFLPTAEQLSGMTLKQTIAKMAATNTAMTAAGAAVEGRPMTFNEFSMNAIIGLGMEGAHHGYASVFDSSHSEANKNYVQVLDELAKQSAFRKRDAAGYAAHMNELSDPEHQPGVPIEAFEKAFPQAAQTAERLGLLDSYTEAKKTGGDVKMSMGTFLSEVMDPHRAKLADDVRFDTDSRTVNQLKTEREEAAAKQEKEQAAAQPKEQGPVEKIVSQIKKALGMEEPAKPAASQADEKALAPLGPTVAPEPVEPEKNKNQVLYHGTIHKIDELKGLVWMTPDAKAAGEFADRQAFANRESEDEDVRGADEYSPKFDKVEAAGQNILPLHVDIKNTLDLRDVGQTTTLKKLSSILHEKGIMEKVDDDTLNDIATDLSTEDLNVNPDTKVPIYRALEGLDAYRDIEKAGHDSVKIVDTDVHGNPVEAVAAFKAEKQVRSALEMDTIKATKHEIAKAQIDLGQVPQKIEGVDPKVAELHAKLEQEALSSAEKILMKPQLEEMKRDESKERASLEAAARVQFDNDPLYQADEFLEKRMGKNAYTRYADGKMTPEEMRLVDAIAEVHGFSSGDELVKKLIGSQKKEPAIKAFVEDLMPKPIRNTPEFRIKAIEAIHNEKMPHLLALKAEIFDGMKEGAGQEVSYREGIRERARIASEDAKGFAKDTIAGKTAGEAGRFRPYYTAERDAALRAYKAAEKGDYEEAAKATREQLQAHALAAESLRERDNVERWTNTLVKAQKADVESFKTQENFDQAAGLLMRFGFERPDFQWSQKTETLADWAKSKSAQMEGAVAIPTWLMNESTVALKHTDLKLSQLHDLSDAIKNIRRVGNIEDEALSIMKGEKISALAEELLAAVDANTEGGKTRRAGDPESRYDKYVTNNSDALRNGIISVPSLLSKLDRFQDGIWTDLLVKSREKQRSVELGMIQDFNSKWRDLHSTFSPGEMRDNDTKPIFIPELGTNKTKNQLITLAAYQGTADGQAKVASDLGIEQPKIDAILHRELSKRDYDLMQAKLDLIGSYRDQIGQLYKRKTGFEPNWVEAKPIKTPFGDKAGGYYPLVPDPLVSQRPIVEMEGDASLADPYPTWKAATQNGYVEARNKYARYPVSLDADGAVRHMTDVIHDLAFNEWVTDANRIVGNKQISAALIDALGREGQQKVNDWVKEIAGNNVKAPRELLEKMSAGLRERTTISMLGSNIAVALSQFHGLTLAGQIEPGFSSIDAISGVAAGFKRLAFDPAGFKEMVHFVHESSPFMRAQSEKIESSLAANNREMYGRNGKMKEATEAISGGFFSAVHYMTSISVWNQAYTGELSRNGFEHDSAVQYADHIIRDSTVTGDAADLPTYMKNSELGKLVSQFAGFFNKQVQASYKAQGRFRNAIGEGEGMSAAPAFLGSVAAIQVIPGLIYALTHYGSPDDKDSKKKWEKALIRSFSPVTMLPVANTVQDMVIDAMLGTRGSSNVVAASTLFDDLQKMISTTASKRAKTEAKVESVARVASLAVPYPQKANDLMFNAYDIAHGMNFQWSDLVKRRPAKHRR